MKSSSFCQMVGMKTLMTMILTRYKLVRKRLNFLCCNLAWLTWLVCLSFCLILLSVPLIAQILSYWDLWYNQNTWYGINRSFISLLPRFVNCLNLFVICPWYGVPFTTFIPIWLLNKLAGTSKKDILKSVLHINVKPKTMMLIEKDEVGVLKGK